MSFGKAVVRGWLRFVLVVACSPRWLASQAALPPRWGARVLGLVARAGASAKARSPAHGGVHRLRVWRGLAPLACGVLLILVMLPLVAWASTALTTGVEASLPANAQRNGSAGLGLVSCVSAGDCTAVGSYADSSGHSQGLLLGETSGTWATGVEASLPANARTTTDAQLDAVSCASAGNCTAVGDYLDSSGRERGLLFTEASGVWASGVEASLPANAGTNPYTVIDAVSCASAGNCTAVGGYVDSSGDGQGLLLTETSGTWATGVEPSLPAGARATTDAQLDAVSCASVGNCTAVGDYGDSSGHDPLLLLTETSGVWATGVEPSLPANASTATAVQSDAVSCASAGNCTAVGYDRDGSGYAQLLLTETSGAWATGVEASLPANATGATDSWGTSVSCASAGNCTAVGNYLDSSFHVHGLLLTETSGRWATGVEASLPAGAGTGGAITSDKPIPGLHAVSCASAGNCTAVGVYDDSSFHVHGLLLTETSGTWATGVAPSLPANARTTSNSRLDSVSCAPAGSCTAAGYYTDSSGHTQGLLLSMSAVALIGNPAANDAGVTDRLMCAPSALEPCGVTETLTTTETIRDGRTVGLSASVRRKSRTVKVATKTVMIKPGKTLSFTVKLNATGRKLLARFGKLPVTLKITLLQNGRHLAIANTKLTVKPKKK